MLVEEVLFILFTRESYSKPEKKRKKQIFKALQKHEVVGIHVKHTDFQDIPVYENDLSPDYIQTPHVLSWNNYPNSDKMRDFDPFNSDMDVTMSQVIDINTQISSEDKDGIFLFVNDDLDNIDPTLKKIIEFLFTIETQFYKSCILDIHTGGSQTVIKNDGYVCFWHLRKYNTEHNESSLHTYISSNLPIEKSRKYHSCDG